MTTKLLVSPDGRRSVTATSQDEIDQLEDEGYVVPSARRSKPEVANSGAEGHRRARAASTTEGQERNTGSTVEGPVVDEDPLDDEDEPDEPDEPDEAKADEVAAARVAQKARQPRKPTT